MDSKKQQVQTLFQKVISMETLVAYDFLKSSKEDPDIIKLVVDLLSNTDTLTQFLTENSDLSHLIPLFSEEQSLVGKTIGHIEFKALLGKGGMGEVYLGEDTQLQRKVAVKTIRGIYRLNLKTKNRFREEALLLSKLDHRNICKIYNLLEQEQADFLILEYIEGHTLNNYPLHKKNYHQKLQLAKELLKGLEVAHQEDIVHRDIKPDNIIIANSGVLKILDFGISSSLSPLKKSQGNSTLNNTSSNHEHDSKNHPEVILGTLGYMSPEQANNEEISTASDIYSTGIIFQEIFSTQFAHPTALSQHELLKRAKAGQSEPLSHVPNDLSGLINRMKSSKPALRPTALDAVAMLDKILDKPKRRMKQLAVLVIFVLTILGFSKYTYDLNQHKILADEAKEAAISAQQESEKVTTFLESIFEVSNPYSNQGKEITARKILQDGANRINDELKDQPYLLARLKLKIGKIFSKLGLFEAARTQLNETIELFDSKSVDDTELHAQVLGQLVELEFEASNYQNMSDLATQAINLLEQNQLTQSSSYLTLKFNLAAATNELGQHKKALADFHELLNIYQQQPEKHVIDLVTTYNYMGLIHADYDEFEAARDNLQKALPLIEDNPKYIEYTLSLYGNLGTIYEDLGEYEKALELVLKTANHRQALLGNDHPLLALSYYNVAEVYCSLGQITKCQEYNNKTIDIYERTNNTKVVEYPKALGFRASILDRDAATEQQAEKLWLQSIQIFREIFNEDHLFIANHLVSLGINYINQNKYQLAIEKNQEAIAIYTKLEYPLRGSHLDAMKNLAYIYNKLDKTELQLETYQNIIELLNKETNPDESLIRSINELMNEVK